MSLRSPFIELPIQIINYAIFKSDGKNNLFNIGRRGRLADSADSFSFLSIFMNDLAL